ncbi:hypothetical protein GQ53DRAFT_848148 [Thozetella sp. PMI_491]|nr:hypothetical protein GQ53DRAFT_848148 [Thozetella sp. PMI_491]
MRLLPPSLLLLIAARIEAQEQQQLPTAVRRMSPDQGEKFFHEYAAFADAQQPALPLVDRRFAVYSEADARLLAANASAELTFRPPFAPHSSADLEQEQPGRSPADDQELRRSWLAREVFRRGMSALAVLQGRQWSCPTGTQSCSSIGFPNSCCATGETCVKITDTGLGSVGCCPTGSTCGGTITNCAPGNTPCASDIGGGCCIPGFVCQGVGCVQSSTSVVTLTSTSTTVISTPTTRTTVTSPTSSATGTSILPPVRPTSTTASGSGGDTSTNSFCPTGFYPCLASAGGGCCQTGRDCQTTSCPPTTYTTIVNTDGVTIVVPASAVPSPTATGHCADNWFLCGKDAGNIAGCCPSGYSCGTASCFLATGGATASVAKELPGRAAALRVHWEAGAVVLAAAAWMLLA